MTRSLRRTLGALLVPSASLWACAGPAFRDQDTSVGGAGGAATGGASGAAGAPFALECIWNRATCQTCDSRCPSDDCQKRCGEVLQCVQANRACATAEDPMCVLRDKSTDTFNLCTAEWERAGGGNDEPSRAAADVFKCACGLLP